MAPYERQPLINSERQLHVKGNGMRVFAFAWRIVFVVPCLAVLLAWECARGLPSLVSEMWEAAK